MGARRFRKKPVEIDAVPAREAIEAATSRWQDMPPWLAAAYDSGAVFFEHDAVTIKTLEGDMRAERDDWIIRGVEGELYPCKPAIFEATYEEVA